jgi:glycosyltransferase involved in cell wall biosynthesis
MDEIAVAVVMATYNRLGLLQKAIASTRRSVGDLGYVIVVVDGGSDDGTREWLVKQPDVQSIWQELPLTGAVKAYNLGFEHAVGTEAPFICIINDDDQFIAHNGAYEIAEAVDQMLVDRSIGGVTFETDLRGEWDCERWRDKSYCNKGVVRRSALMASARAQGDPEGCRFWSTEWKTYAADTQAGLLIWKLGWSIVEGKGLRVRDNARDGGDAMRKANVDDYVKGGTAKVFTQRWSSPMSANYNPEFAIKYGGRIEPQKPVVRKHARCYGAGR